MSDSESLVERQIREATERGEFDGLAGTGQPIEGLAQSDDPNWWARSFVERQRSDDARLAEFASIEAAVGDLWTVRSEARVRERVTGLNKRIDDLNATARGEPMGQLDVEDIISAWRAMTRARLSR